MTEHSELYDRIIKAKTDETQRHDAFREAGPTLAAYRKMSKVRQAARRDAEKVNRDQSAATMLGELMQIACELYSPMGMIALMTRIVKPAGDGQTESHHMANLLLGELIEKSLQIERKRVTNILAAQAA
jgi:hypothetical protein